MSDYKGGGIPTPDYDKDDVTIFNDKTEFTDDVFVYGKLYADFGGELNSFTGDVEVFQKNFPTLMKFLKKPSLPQYNFSSLTKIAFFLNI